MKKFFIILLIAIMVPACVFAGRGIFDLTVGAVAAYNQNIAAIEAGSYKNITKDNFSDFFTFGADVEMKVWIVDVDAKAFYSKADNGDNVLNGLVSANIGFDILGLVRIKAGLGYDYDYNLTTNKIGFGNGTEGGHVTEFGDFQKACFDIHAGADILIGPVTVGVYGTLPTAVSISKGNWNEAFTTAFNNWENANVGVSVGFALL